MAEAQNTPAGSTTTGSIAVAAESTVATRMSAPPSYDVADFPVPHGREEEWRSPPSRACGACTTAPPWPAAPT